MDIFYENTTIPPQRPPKPQECVKRSCFPKRRPVDVRTLGDFLKDVNFFLKKENISLFEITFTSFRKSPSVGTSTGRLLGKYERFTHY